MRQKKVPVRKCIACQGMRPKKELIRIVRTPELDILIDKTGKKSGRGAYICQSIECLRLAKSKKALEKALETKINEDIYAKLEMEMVDNG